MSKSLELLEAEVLKLAPSDRLHLIERLVASLGSDPAIEKVWKLEADAREAMDPVLGATADQHRKPGFGNSR